MILEVNLDQDEGMSFVSLFFQSTGKSRRSRRDRILQILQAEIEPFKLIQVRSALFCLVKCDLMHMFINAGIQQIDLERGVRAGKFCTQTA